MSHTVTIKVVLKNKVALERGVVRMEGKVLGEGVHRLFAGEEAGWGFSLPKWKFPLVLKEGGEMAFDDYSGRWGELADLDRLKELYSLEVAKEAAMAQGWMCEEVKDCLLIHHPSGGTLTVAPGGVVDASDFIGGGCASATASLEAALGLRQEEVLKDEYFLERASVQVTGA